MTYRQIADKSGLSIETVKPTMQALLNSNFLKKINNGCYQVNPEVLFKGGHRGRMKVLYDYEQINTETVSETDEEIKNNTLTEVQTYEKCANTRGTIPQNM
jgi:DNA replication protein DnaD